MKSCLTSALAKFPGGSDSEVSDHNAGDPGSIPGLGRSPGEGNGTLLQYSCLENPTDGGAWYCNPWGRRESDTIERLHFTYYSLLILKTRCLGGLVSSVQNLRVRDVTFDWQSCIFVSSTHLDIFLFVVENLFIQFSNPFHRESATCIVAVIEMHALVLTCQIICNTMDVVHQESTRLLCPWDQEC